MKKMLFLTVILSFVCSMAYADPFMTCDPIENVTKYEVVVDGVTEQSQANPDGSAWHDIGSWSPGAHTGNIRAGGQFVLNGNPQAVWRWSDTVPFDLIIPSPSVENLEIVP